MICRYAENCGGCSQWSIPYDKQIESKQDFLSQLSTDVQAESQLANKIEILNLKSHGLRDRADFQIGPEGEVGFYNKLGKQIVDVEVCLQMSDSLQVAYSFLRQFRFPIRRGSIRLRKSAHVSRPGLWLDFANEDVKKLFENPQFLRSLLSKFEIEIGQRRKILVWSDLENGEEGRLRLVDPKPNLWFATSIKNKLEPIYSLVGSFTQAGTAINKVLVEKVLQLAAPFKTVLELGCGIGNFSLPLAADGKLVTAADNDSLALQCLKLSTSELKLNSISALHLDFYHKKEYGAKLLPLLAQSELLLVDPPRSGLGTMLEPLQNGEASSWPQAILYVSCHPDSWKKDAMILHSSGYQLVELCGVDQFPQTNHLEIVSLFKRQ